MKKKNLCWHGQMKKISFLQHVFPHTHTRHQMPHHNSISMVTRDKIEWSSLDCCSVHQIPLYLPAGSIATENFFTPSFQTGGEKWSQSLTRQAEERGRLPPFQKGFLDLDKGRKALTSPQWWPWKPIEKEEKNNNKWVEFFPKVWRPILRRKLAESWQKKDPKMEGE